GVREMRWPPGAGSPAAAPGTASPRERRVQIRLAEDAAVEASMDAILVAFRSVSRWPSGNTIGGELHQSRTEVGIDVPLQDLGDRHDMRIDVVHFESVPHSVPPFPGQQERRSVIASPIRRMGTQLAGSLAEGHDGCQRRAARDCPWPASIRRTSDRRRSRPTSERRASTTTWSRVVPTKWFTLSRAFVTSGLEHLALSFVTCACSRMKTRICCCSGCGCSRERSEVAHTDPLVEGTDEKA